MISKTARHLIKRYLIVIVLIPLCVFLVLVPFSLLLGWNTLTIFLFWFVILPLIILYLSSKLIQSANRNKLWYAMISMVCFYGFVVFMTYKHYQTDFFTLTMASFVWNLLITLLIIFVERQDKISA